MATTTRTKKTTTKKATKATEPEVVKEIVVKEVQIDPSDYVTVRNGFQGALIYKSPKTGEVYEWESFGDEQEMELRELKNARNSSKKFFTNNWFMFDDEWVIDWLGVRNFYKNSLKVDKFDDIFDLKGAKLKERIEKLPAGQKKSVAYRAHQLIADKKIDSLSTIATLEEALGIELIEK